MSDAKKQFTFGCDPEFFVYRLNDPNKKPVPVCGLVGGTKEKPLELGEFPFFKHEFKEISKWKVQEDGAALELNSPPMPTLYGLASEVEHVLKGMTKFLATLGLGLLNNHSRAKFSEAQLKDPSAELANKIGCDPDFDAYSGTLRAPFDIAQFGNRRFAGGHIHVGYDLDIAPPEVMAKLLDLWIGMPLVISGERQTERRNFYGLAGLYRPKPYGLEYRTPSNFWTWRFNEGNGSVASIFHNVRNLTDLLTEETAMMAQLYKAVPWKDVAHAMVTEDTELCKQILLFCGKQFPTTDLAGLTNRITGKSLTATYAANPMLEAIRRGNMPRGGRPVRAPNPAEFMVIDDLGQQAAAPPPPAPPGFNPQDWANLNAEFIGPARR